MKLQDDIDFTTLSWIKQELDETLKQAHQALESYVSDPADTNLMRFCATYLHQVQGTLRMVELYGAAMVVEEMEHLVQALLEDRVSQRDEAYGVLMRGIVQLPDYLERLQSGYKDIPIILLPLLNDLRACYGEKLLTESVLFSPNLGATLPPREPNAPVLPLQELRAGALKLRLSFQVALLKWFRDEGAQETLAKLQNVLDRLFALCSQDDARRLWWVAAAVTEAINDGGLEASVAVKLLFGRIDREIKQLAEFGEEALHATLTRELVKNLLYYIAHSTSTTSRVMEIRRTYQLDKLLPTEKELEHARGNISGHNRTLLDTVSQAIKEDLIRVKEGLDIFLRAQNADPAQLVEQVEALHRVADTLGMLGLGVPRRVVTEQRDIIEQVANGSRSVEESTLLDVAGALLYVESSLDEHIERLGASHETSSEGLELPKSEVRKLLDTLMREAIANIQQVKHDIVAFVESPWNHDRIEQIPRLLKEIEGMLNILALPESAVLLSGVVLFIEVELIRLRRVPTTEQMDKLADTLASMEYYFEATREQRSGREKILDMMRDSLTVLGYWPIPENKENSWLGAEVQLPHEQNHHAAAESVEERGATYLQDHLAASSQIVTDIVENADDHVHEFAESTADVGDGWIEIVEEIEEDVPIGGVAETAFQHAASDDIDDEIREVFVEEVQEEINNLNQHMPVWKLDVNDFEKLKPIRRAFHTLKGSGRLVGALALGEFSWKVENMLNRVLDQSIAPTPPVVALVDQAIELLPGLLAALRGEGVPQGNMAGIMETADRLAAGEQAWVPEPSAVVQTHKVKRLVRRRVPVTPIEAVELPILPTADFSHTEEQTATVTSANTIEPVLFEVLKSEVTLHLAAVEDYLNQCEPEPTHASASLLRAIHTMNGAVAMVEIPTLSRVLAPLESYIKRLRTSDATPDSRGVMAMRDACTLIRHTIEKLEQGRQDLPDAIELSERISLLRDELPESTTVVDLYTDAELLPTTETTVVEETLEPCLGDHVEQPSSIELSLSSEDEFELGAFNASLEEPSRFVDAPDVQIEQRDADDEFTADEFVAELSSNASPLENAIEFTEDSAVLTPGVDDHAEDSPSLIELSLQAEATPELSTEGFELGSSTFIDAVENSLEQANTNDALELTVSLDAPVAEHTSDATVLEDAIELVDESTAVEVVPVEASAEEPRAQEPRAQHDTQGAEHAQVGEPAQKVVSIVEDVQPEGRLELLDMDEELLAIFIQEATDILDHSDSLMAKLREAAHEREWIVELQRDLHTLKGGAGMANITPVGELAHVMESLLEAVSEGRFSMDRMTIELLERGFDRLHGLVQRVAHRQAIGIPEQIIAQFERLIAGDTSALTAEVKSEVTSSFVEPEPTKEIKALPARRLPAALLTPEEDETSRLPQEMIRVRSDLLDSLVNYAGEVSIYRSRLEQQIASFRFNLLEFEQTVSRLREQLRKLEIETEAQIIARYQREHHDQDAATFDPLELDRFSQLQQLSRALAESVSDLVSIQGLLDELTRQSETLLLQQSRVSSDLQEGLMRTRMVPFESLVPNLRRTLRQAAQEMGKRAQLKVEGAQGEMDRNLLERMKAPFEHMLRNALVHGIETPEERLKAGKPLDGTILIQVAREATEVVLRLSDDGRGMDREAIRRKAIERGVLKPEAELSDRDLYGFIFETGFSTAERVTQLAGRGVGMDIVHNEIKQMGGALAIESQAGQGSTFVIRLPFTLAITQAILVRLGEAVYAIPMSSVQGVVRITQEELEKRLVSDKPSYQYAGEEFLIYELAQLLGVPKYAVQGETQQPLLMVRTGDQRAAIRIDAVVGSREVVVKSVGPQVSSVPGIFGATIMGDGSVVMILDLAPLVRRIVALRERVQAGEVLELPQHIIAAPIEEQKRQPLVMVVDDSITMRKVTTRVLERADMKVVTAQDGLDAVEKLQEVTPDLMLLDIEMPRMDGYELATYMKNDTRLKRVPIIMITSRTGEKHRQRALEIGVERYLGKPYQEADLLVNVQETLGLHRADA